MNKLIPLLQRRCPRLYCWLYNALAIYYRGRSYIFSLRYRQGRYLITTARISAEQIEDARTYHPGLGAIPPGTLLFLLPGSATKEHAVFSSENFQILTHEGNGLMFIPAQLLGVQWRRLDDFDTMALLSAYRDCL